MGLHCKIEDCNTNHFDNINNTINTNKTRRGNIMRNFSQGNINNDFNNKYTSKLPEANNFQSIYHKNNNNNKINNNFSNNNNTYNAIRQQPETFQSFGRPVPCPIPKNKNSKINSINQKEYIKNPLSKPYQTKGKIHGQI